jgi:hypothetical protein
MSKTVVRSEERDPETLYQQLTNREPQGTDCCNAVIAMSGILLEQERRIQRLQDRMNNLGMVNERTGKTIAAHFVKIDERINSLGFPP